MVLESIEEGQYEPRRTITSLQPGLYAALKSIDHNDDGHGELSALVADMAGGSIEPGSSPEQGKVVTDAVDTPGSQSAFNMPLPLDGISIELHEQETFNVDTIFATPSSDWVVT